MKINRLVGGCSSSKVATMLELCLFRHGRTKWNAQGRYQGHADIDLDELGKLQAAMVADRVAAMKAVSVYSSDLKRCVKTAEAITHPSGDSIATDKRLRERDVGHWSGHTREEIQRDYPDQFKLWIAGEEVRPGNGETSAEMLTRIKDFLNFIAETHKSGTVVAVTHGGWVKTAAQWVLTRRIERIGLGVPTQGALTVFSYDNDQWRLEAYNDRGHLNAVEPVDTEPPAPNIV